MLYALGRDPLYLRYTRMDAVAGLVDLMVEAQAGRQARLPTLVLLGARDQIVKPQAARRFVATLDPDTCASPPISTAGTCCCATTSAKKSSRDILAWVDG